MSILFLLTLLFGRDVIKTPAILARDSGTVIVSAKKGGQRWTAGWTMEPIERNGKKAVRFTERGQGHISPFSSEVRWSVESIWSAEPPGFQPLESERTVTTPTGMRLLVERKHLDPVKGVLRFERQPATGAAEEKVMTISPDTLIPEGIAGVLRYLMFEGTRKFPAHVLSNEPRLYRVTFESRGKERIRTPAGEFECYKIEMVPHVGPLNLGRYFAPEAFFWFTVEAPHFWVRYQGSENGPGTPEVVMELDRASR
jgi:hypothetical protein